MKLTSILLAAFVLTYLALLQLVTLLLPIQGAAPHLAVSLATSLLGIFSFPYLKKSLERLTDPIFFKKSYVYSEAVSQLSENLNRHLDLETEVTGIRTALPDATH